MLRPFGVVTLGSLLLLSTVAVPACGSDDGDSKFGSSSGGNEPGSSGGTSSGGFGGSSSGGFDASAEADECKKMDIVFVIDNSGSMQQEQDNLGDNFPKFIQVINDYKTKSGAPLDYRVAVITTDDKNSGLDKGKFRTTPGAGGGNCNAGDSSKKWFSRGDTNVASEFTCRARAGISGDNVERGLECMKSSVTNRITDGSNAMNGEGFVRDDALLAFVIISDEDDGGSDNNGTGNPVKDAASYTADFDGLKGDRAKWASAIIAGPGPGVCTSAFGNAAEAVRYKNFISAVGKNGIFSSICSGDLTKGLSDALAVFDAACKNFPGGVK